MADLRIEFFQGMIGDARNRDPIGALTLTVTGSATSGGARPVVPAALQPSPIVAVFLSDGPVYVDVGSAPDPTISAQATLIYPARQVELVVSAGDLISAITATDIVIPTVSTGATVDAHGSSQVVAYDSTGVALDFTSPAATKGSLIQTTDLTGAVINTVSSGDNTIVAAVSGQTTRVHRLRLHAAGALTVTVKRGTTTLEKLIFDAAGNRDLAFTERPYWTTAANEAFILNLGGAVQLDGRIEYVTGA